MEVTEKGNVAVEEIAEASTGEIVPGVEGDTDTGLTVETEKKVSIDDIVGDSDEQVKANIQKGKEGTPPWYQKRIDKMAAEKNKALARVRELEAKVSAPSERPKVPRESEFETDESYQKAMVDYQENLSKYNNAQETLNTVKERDEDRIIKNNERLLAQVETLKDRYPDALDRIQKTEYGASAEAIQDSAQSAKIGLYLSLNPDVLERISSLGSDREIYKEIGKLEQKFDAAEARKKTKAPQPLNTIDGYGDTEIKDPSKMTDAEWFAHRKREKIRKMKARL